MNMLEEAQSQQRCIWEQSGLKTSLLQLSSFRNLPRAVTNLLSSRFVPDLVDLEFTKENISIMGVKSISQSLCNEHFLQDFSTSKYS